MIDSIQSLTGQEQEFKSQWKGAEIAEELESIATGKKLQMHSTTKSTLIAFAPHTTVLRRQASNVHTHSAENSVKDTEKE